MNGLSRRGATLHGPQPTRSNGSRFGDLGDRLARTFFATPEPRPRAEHPIEDPHPTALLDPVLPPFPVVKQGYDCETVDQHLANVEEAFTELERELAELRAQTPSKTEVEVEIERIGEQTSAILIAAHEEARQTVSQAQAQAESCVADATSYAAALTEEANQTKRQVQEETAAIRRERARLISEIESTANALSSLAKDDALH